MQDERYQEIVEAAWRRPLTAQERAELEKFLSADPGARERWREEAALGRLIEKLPAAPVSTNFTARVLQSVRAEQTPQTRRRWFDLSQWLPENPGWRIAVCGMALGLGFFSFYETQSMRRTQEARQIANVSELATLPPVDWLKDFETIKAMNQVKVADDELLTVLQ